MVTPPNKDTPSSSSQWSVISFRGSAGEVLTADLRMPPGNGRKPAVVILGADRKTIGPVAFLISRYGYATLVFDLAGTGPRKEPGAPELEKMLPTDFLRYGARTVVDLRRAVDLLSSRPDIDPKKIGFVGVSVGGIVGARYFSDDPRAATGVFLSVGADLVEFLTKSTLVKTELRDSKTQSDLAEIARIIEPIDPLHSIGRAAGRPIVLVHGDNDIVVPEPCFDRFFNAAKEPKKRVVIPGGHVPDPLSAVQVVVQFLDKNLKK